MGPADGRPSDDREWHLMGSIGELVGIVALLVVTGLCLLTACLCVVAKIADAEIREHRRRKGQP